MYSPAYVFVTVKFYFGQNAINYTVAWTSKSKDEDFEAHDSTFN